MKIYLDACCLNRPFDNQNQNRVRLESEAILIILNRLHLCEWEWIGSEALEIEIENTPDIERKFELLKLASCIQRSVKIREKEFKRAKNLESLGFKPFDAMHLACAESGNADMFLTTDDGLRKLAIRRKEKLHVNVQNPLFWLSEVL